MSLNARDINALHALVNWRVSQPGGSEWALLLDKLSAMRSEHLPKKLVFRIELPLEPVPVQNRRKTVNVRLAPTLNEYAGQPAWMRDLARKEVDRRIEALKFQFPHWECWKQVCRKLRPARQTPKGKMVEAGFVEKIVKAQRRFVRVTRRSAGKHDEPSTDAIGGKIPIDRLRICGVIAGDSQKWLGREAVWQMAPRGEGSVVIEVFDE
ncbi:hypothetical protein EKK58_05160 [Candidatus Dependentiae bacterium]|nr:MAG: hypothetical protein EKK58_05160 [Candidatus Dependentiae bacterium]